MTNKMGRVTSDDDVRNSDWLVRKAEKKIRMTAKEKSEEIIKRKQCFKISSSRFHEIWTVKGLTNNLYDVVYHTANEQHTCSCKNIKLSDCCHIMAVKKLQSQGLDGLADY